MKTFNLLLSQARGFGSSSPRSGAGNKSTLTIFVKFLDYTDGRFLLLHWQNIRDVRATGLRSQIVLVAKIHRCVDRSAAVASIMYVLRVKQNEVLAAIEVRRERFYCHSCVTMKGRKALDEFVVSGV